MDAGLDLDALRVQIDAWRGPVRPHVPLADSACRLPLPAGTAQARANRLEFLEFTVSAPARPDRF
jgi:hypothetical protein